MIMKSKLSKLIYFLPVLVLGLASCSSDDDNKPEELDFSGIWYMSEMTATAEEQASDYKEYINKDGYFVFDDDNPSLLLGSLRYKLDKISGSSYNCRTYDLFHKRYSRMESTEYIAMVESHDYTVDDLIWQTTKEPYSITIDGDKWIWGPDTLEIVKAEKDYLKVRWKDIDYDADDVVEDPVDRTAILRRSENKVLPIESNCIYE